MATIGTNIGAVSASNYLTANSEAFTANIKKMSSGSRLANPVDDAAGVAVSGNLVARIRRLSSAVAGVQDIVSFAQTADGFLSTLQGIATRLSELTQNLTNGAFNSTDRANYQTEAGILTAQFNSIVNAANFNGTLLFTGAAISNDIGVAIDSSGNTDSFKASQTTNSLSTISGIISNYGTAANFTDGGQYATSFISSINSVLTSITTARASVNADISKFNFYISNIRTENVNVQAANSRIYDLNVATESTNLSKNNILVQASTAMLAQANTSQSAVLSLLR